MEIQMSLIVPREQARFLFRMAYVSFLSSLYAIYRGHYDLSMVPFSVGCSTMLYWSEPRYGWRRNVDMCTVFLALCYQLYRASAAEMAMTYYPMTILAILCYPAGIYQHQKGNTWSGVYIHSGIHWVANIANIVLYSGAITPSYAKILATQLDRLENMAP